MICASVADLEYLKKLLLNQGLKNQEKKSFSLERVVSLKFSSCNFCLHSTYETFPFLNKAYGLWL